MEDFYKDELQRKFKTFPDYILFAEDRFMRRNT